MFLCLQGMRKIDALEDMTIIEHRLGLSQAHDLTHVRGRATSTGDGGIDG